MSWSPGPESSRGIPSETGTSSALSRSPCRRSVSSIASAVRFLVAMLLPSQQIESLRSSHAQHMWKNGDRASRTKSCHGHRPVGRIVSRNTERLENRLSVVCIDLLIIGPYRGPLSLGICIAKKETLNYLPRAMDVTATDKSREVLCMCWEHQSTDRVHELAMGHPPIIYWNLLWLF